MVHIDERESGSGTVEEHRPVDTEHPLAVPVSSNVHHKHRALLMISGVRATGDYRASVIYLVIMLYVVYYHLQETRPCLWFILSFLLFAASQAVLFLASQPLCEVSREWVLASSESSVLRYDAESTHL
jgi:hypothetical protein